MLFLLINNYSVSDSTEGVKLKHRVTTITSAKSAVRKK
ncbi:hypothetical protein HAZELMIKA_57 [Klebsiella phage vB_KaeD_HazelMika]|nr:hypothetical protein HAZELMIKA_57 [Klebsiella phage vB_KaeD_HazelMika]